MRVQEGYMDEPNGPYSVLGWSAIAEGTGKCYRSSQIGLALWLMVMEEKLTTLSIPLSDIHVVSISVGNIN